MKSFTSQSGSSGSITATLLRYLDRHAGETLKLRDLQKALSDDGRSSNKGDKDEKSGKAKSKNRGRARVKQRTADAESLAVLMDNLELLASLRLIEFVGAQKIAVRKPFYVEGRVSFSPKGPAFVAARGAERGTREIFIAPPDTRNALDGDLVLVRLKDRGRDRDRFEGAIINVAERSRTFHRVRLLEDPRSDAGKFVVGETLDAPSRMIACADISRLPEDSRERLREGVVIVVRLSGKRIHFEGARALEATFERFEDDTDLDTDFARILMKYDLDPAYPSDVELPKEAVAAEEPTKRNVRDWKKRRDLRDIETITIDGAESKDFDDALSLVPAGRGKAKLYVHIADVSHYVARDTPLDQEAQRRATSYYLSNRVVPMLPPVLSENLCSLVADCNRLAFTCEMDVRLKDGKILAAYFYKSIIRVDQRLTYEIAEDFLHGKFGRAALDGRPIARSIAELVQSLWKMAQAQRNRRMKAGRIDLDIPEAKVKIDAQTDRVESISYRERLKSSMLIEECMLSANICVAAYLKQQKANALYRVHQPMDPQKIANLNMFFESYNINFTLKDARHASIAKAMETVANHSDAKRLQHIFQTLLLRSFMQASYSPEPGGHWGLGFDDYCHFTSPIRRYPDLVVHRALQNVVERKKPCYSPEEVVDLGNHTSEQERRAMEAERDTFRLKVMRYIEQEELRTFTGFITGFKYDRVFLEIEGLPIEAIVEAQHLTNERELLLTDKFSAFIKNLGRPALLGEKWELELDRLDTEAMRIFCKPVFRTRKPRGREEEQESRGERRRGRDRRKK